MEAVVDVTETEETLEEAEEEEVSKLKLSYLYRALSVFLTISI